MAQIDDLLKCTSKQTILSVTLCSSDSTLLDVRCKNGSSKSNISLHGLSISGDKTQDISGIVSVKIKLIFNFQLSITWPPIFKKINRVNSAKSKVYYVDLLRV